MLANHHSHTNFSDGSLEPEAYVQEAIKKNLLCYGFSDHAPIPASDQSLMRMEDLPAYLDRIDQIRMEVGDEIEIHKSLEVDYIPGVMGVSSAHVKAAQLDYTLGAVHYVGQLEDSAWWTFESDQQVFQRGIDEIYAGDIRQLIHAYYSQIRAMVELDCPDIVAHLDRIKKHNQESRYFDESAEWYRAEVLLTLEAIAAAGCIMEVNTKGYYKGEIDDMYPSRWVLEYAREMDIPVHLASDAHHPDVVVGGFRHGIRTLRQVGYRRTKIFLDRHWQDLALQRPRIYVG